MARYRYTAKNEAGKTVRGQLEAASEQALYEQLRTDGLLLMDAHQVREGSGVGYAALKTAQIADFCRSLGTLLAAGVPLVRAFAILAEEEGLDPKVRTVYEAVRTELRKGIALSDAMQGCAPAFPPLLIAMIRSGEGTGNMDQSAMRMAVYYEKEHKLNQEVGNSLMYPAILVVLLIAVVAILMGFVVPQFQPMFDQMETLPLPTVILLGISDFMAENWFILIVVLVLVFLAGRVIFSIPEVHTQLDRFILHAPVIGKLNRKICTARFARTLSNLYSCGLPIVAALSAGRDTVGNMWIASQFETVLQNVRTGQSLSQSLSQVDGFEKKLSSSIAVGEETGKLDDLLATISETMDFEAEVATKRLMTLIEPVMIVLIAFVVAFVIVAVILPIYLSYGTIGGSSGAI